LLTRFERARIISARALQIDLGAPLLIKSAGGDSSIQIAEKEFEKGVLPITVVRRLPNGDEVLLNSKGELVSV